LSLFCASSNPGKLREFSEAAAVRRMTVQPLPGFAQLPVCVEDGSTFDANARKKAIHYSAGCEELVFADDSGICVDALDGAPGIYSARFAGPNATDQQNNALLLAELRRKEATYPPRRAAHYICSIALARKGRVLTVVEGRVDGLIIDEPKGTGGFGYDPYFFSTELDKTFGEASRAEKEAVSHRGRAFRALLEAMDSLGDRSAGN